MHRKANVSALQRGAVTVEFALAAIVLLALMLGIIDFGRMHYCRSRVQYAVSQATRFAVVGSTLADPVNPGQKLSRNDSIVYLIKKLSGLPDLSSSDVKITSVHPGSGSVSGPGGPGDVVTVAATYRVPLVAPLLANAFPGRRFEFTCATSFRNEEFTPTPG